MRLLNFGSLNIDYVYRVDNFVQPGETKAASSRSIFAGGKGLNQSIALARAGARPYHAGLIGSEGRVLAERLAAEGVDVGLIELRERSENGHTIIQVDDAGRNSILYFPGANREIDSAYIDRVLDGFGRGDYILVQNEISRVGEILEKSSGRGMIPVLNPSPCEAAVSDYPLDKVGIFMLNELEAAELSGEPEPSRAARVLSSRFPEALVLVTLGSEGSVCLGSGREIRQKAYPVKAVDTTAAGDTYTGYFLAGLVEGMDLAQAMDLAARAASICVTRLGASASIPKRSELG